MGFFKNFSKIGAVVNPALALGAITSIGPEMYSAREARKANDRANDANRRIAEENVAMQREFAQNGIRWRVEDARAAGIHPLYAIGAAGATFSPVANFVEPDYSYSNMYRNMGQDISRAMMAAATRDERNDTFTSLQLENARLQNDLLRAQTQSVLRSLNSPGTGPGLPSNSDMPRLTGQGNGYPTARSGSSGYVVENPLERVHSQPGRPAQEVGAVTDFGFARTNTGLAIVPSRDVKERIEDQLVPELSWAFRNQLMPNFGGIKPPSPKYYPLPRGYKEWRWSPWAQEFRPWRPERPLKRPIKSGRVWYTPS